MGEKLSIILVDDAGHEYVSAVRAQREYRFAWWKYLHGPAAIAPHVNRTMIQQMRSKSMAQRVWR